MIEPELQNELTQIKFDIVTMRLRLELLESGAGKWTRVDNALIKDDKLRSLVERWAEYYGIKRVKYLELSSIDKHYLRDACGDRTIDVDIPNLESKKVYTIEELCGREECWS